MEKVTITHLDLSWHRHYCLPLTVTRTAWHKACLHFGLTDGHKKRHSLSSLCCFKWIDHIPYGCQSSSSCARLKMERSPLKKERLCQPEKPGSVKKFSKKQKDHATSFEILFIIKGQDNKLMHFRDHKTLP